MRGKRSFPRDPLLTLTLALSSILTFAFILPLALTHLHSGLLEVEHLIAHALGATPVAHGPLREEEWQLGARTMVSLIPPPLVPLSSTCRQLRASTRTERERLHSAVGQLRKLTRDLKIEPLALRHAVAIEWAATKPVPLRTVRCERLAGLLFECASLVSLLLGKSGLTDASLQTLLVPIRQNALPRLRVLNLNDNPQLGDEGVAALATVLRPPCASCGVPFAIGDNSRTVACRTCRCVPTYRATPLTALRSLEIVGCAVSDAGTEALATALAPGSAAWRLTFLALGSDGIGEAGARALASALDAGAMRSAIEMRVARLWSFGRFSSTCGAGFAALTRACDRHGVVLELDHGTEWGS